MSGMGRWKIAWLTDPPMGVAMWCLVQPHGEDDEPYLIECEAGEGRGNVRAFDGAKVNILPPHHEIILWRLK